MNPVQLHLTSLKDHLHFGLLTRIQAEYFGVSLELILQAGQFPPVRLANRRARRGLRVTTRNYCQASPEDRDEEDGDLEEPWPCPLF